MKDIAAEAEGIIKNLQRDKSDTISLKTNQIRKFLTAVNTVTSKVNLYRMLNMGENQISEELAGDIKYLKVKLAYQAGRDKTVKDFALKAKLSERIDAIGNSFARYDEFAKFVEALVAYHKYHGGRD